MSVRHDAFARGIETILRALAKGRDWGPLEAEAFRFAESARAFGLAERMGDEGASRTSGAASDLAREVDASHARIRGLQRTLVTTTGPEALRVYAEIDAAYRILEEAEVRLQRATREQAAASVRPGELDEFQRSLDARGRLVLYLFTDEHLAALVVWREGSELVDLGERKPIEDAVRRYARLAAQDRSNESKLARRLYDTLLRPLEALAPAGTRLLIAPDGALTYLPLECLLRQGQRAAVRYDMLYVPSATVYTQLAESPAPRRATLVALGDPQYPPTKEPSREMVLRGLTSLVRLKGTAEEVNAIGKLFADKTLLMRGDATREGLREALANGPVTAMHLACHGHVDSEHPRLSGLVLANGEVLNVGDVYRLRVPARLVVLSACETGKGKLVKGEGVVGLARAFFFAGAPRVVVSNWKVSDTSTRDLMVAFYTKLLKERLAPAAALRAAKLEMMKKRPHPYHWAGFVLWGRGE